MLKVMLVLRQLVLRLKEGLVDVVIKKHKESVILGSQLKVIDGLCHANLTTEFYLNPNDTVMSIQIILSQGKQRKLAGNVTINLF